MLKDLIDSLFVYLTTCFNCTGYAPLNADLQNKNSKGRGRKWSWHFGRSVKIGLLMRTVQIGGSE
jgi:hypothetical protein